VSGPSVNSPAAVAKVTATGQPSRPLRLSRRSGCSPEDVQQEIAHVGRQWLGRYTDFQTCRGRSS
jgi:hypothetical protein